jgi:predicted HTH transcriptional regulator
MKFSIDLKELASREGESVEWKESGDDLHIAKSIAKTISAFANDIANFGGGYVVCGAKEVKDEHGFPKLVYKGLTANKLKEIEGRVTQICRDHISPALAPIVEELENPADASTRILVFVVIASPADAHTFTYDGESDYYVRIGRETRQAKNGILQKLLATKNRLEYFDQRICANASESDIDLVYFRDSMQEMGMFVANKPLEDYFSDREQIAALVPPLFARTTLDGVFRPKNFTVLMFGRKEKISLLFTDAHAVLSFYEGVEEAPMPSDMSF